MVFFAKIFLGKLGQNDPFWAPKTGIVTGNPSGGSLNGKNSTDTFLGREVVPRPGPQAQKILKSSIVAQLYNIIISLLAVN